MTEERSTTIAEQAAKARLLRSLHVAGHPLIVPNVWDAASARIVASVPGVAAIATASHSISSAHGVEDGEGLSLEDALAVAKTIIDAVELPVTVDFERGYAATAAGVAANVGFLIEAGAHGLNIEDSTGRPDSPLFPLDEQVARIAAARSAANRAGVPLVINARVDGLIREPHDWADTMLRANAYLAAGADSIFAIGLHREDRVRQALAEIHGLVSVLAGPRSAPLKRLAELGVARISFGGGTLGLALAALKQATGTLISLGDYPSELDFPY